MNYEEAISYLHSLHRFGSRPGLDRIQRLLGLLGDPHLEIPVVHIGGTNGKGSVAAMMDSVLTTAGYKTGRYISPYLEEFTERISINGRPIPRGELVELVNLVAQKVGLMKEKGWEHPTEFEVVTALGFLYFAIHKVEILVLEVGLGGRCDATNVVPAPLVSVITNIGYDHMEQLGSTLPKIAAEKAGIIKPGKPVVTSRWPGEAWDVIARVCRERGCRLITIGEDVRVKERSPRPDGQEIDIQGIETTYRNLWLPLLGYHQAVNAATAVAALELISTDEIRVGEDSIRKGLARTSWPGRVEVMKRKPLVVLDGAHNPQGAASLRATLDEHFPAQKRILVLGVLGDKMVRAMLEELVPGAERVITTEPPNPRALPARELAGLVAPLCPNTSAVESHEDAVVQALQWAKEDDLVLVAGSLYLVGTVRTFLRRYFSGQSKEEH